MEDSKNPLKVACCESDGSPTKCVFDWSVLFILGMSLLSLVGLIGVVATKSSVFGVVFIVGTVSLLVVGIAGSIGN